MVILRSQNKITDFLMILAWASPFKIVLALRIGTGRAFHKAGSDIEKALDPVLVFIRITCIRKMGLPILT